MTAAVDHRALLRNAVRQEVSGLTAVEVDSDYRARELAGDLETVLTGRPRQVIDMSAVKGSASLLAERAAEIVGDWPSDIGVLMVKDGGKKLSADFWRDINAYRETLGGLPCHVVFFLTPPNYRLLIQVADHLADWIPLKLHIVSDEDALAGAPRSSESESSFSSGRLSPRAARETLAALEKQLARALEADEPKSRLTHRYYLPMFEAALALGDLRRAEAIRGRIEETHVPEQDRFNWYEFNFQLDQKLMRLDRAMVHVARMRTFAKRVGDKYQLARAYHAFGLIAQSRRAFDEAEAWYRKALEIVEENGIGVGAADLYHQLGTVAQELREFNEAEVLYRKALNIMERIGNEIDSASTCHNLGIIARERRAFDKAEVWFRKALVIRERLGDEAGASGTYHELGRIAGERRALDEAEDWFRKALEIMERTGNEIALSGTYHNLGIIAEMRQASDEAEAWYRKSLEIEERLGDTAGAGLTRLQLGALFGSQKKFEESARWLIHGIRTLQAVGDAHSAENGQKNYMVTFRIAPLEIQSKLKKMWRDAGLGGFPPVNE